MDLVRLIRKGCYGLPEIPISLEKESFFISGESINCNFSKNHAWVRLRWPLAELEYTFWHILAWRMCCLCCVAELSLWQGGTEGTRRHTSVEQEMCEGPRSSSGHQSQTKWPQSCPREQQHSTELVCPRSTRKGETEGSREQLRYMKGSGHSRKVFSLHRGMAWDNPLSSSPEEPPILWHLGAPLSSGSKISSVFLKDGAQLGLETSWDWLSLESLVAK